MKTPEDEAFDDLAKRQGGFQAKRTMAADKLQEPAQLTEKEKISREMTAEIAAARALAQPAQEPAFGWIKQSELAQARLYGGSVNLWLEKHDCDFPLYTTPPQRTWVGLTDEAVLDIADYCLCDGGKTYGVLDFARAIEAAHGIKE